MAYKRGGYYYATAYDHGRRVYIKAGPSKKVAEQIERDLKTKIVKGEYLGIYDEKRVLFRDFIPRYLAYSQANKRPESASRDERSLKALAESFGDRYLSEITCEMIEAHKERRLQSVKPATVNKELAALKHLYTLAMKWKYVSRNPVKEVKLLKEPPGRLRYLLPGEYFRLLHACALHSPTLKAIVVCARNTGMRQGEILGLTWADVNLRERTVTLRHTKNNELRVVPVNDTLLTELRGVPRPLDPQARIFDRWTRQALTMTFRRAAKRAGIADFRFHDLRHDFASQLVMRGANLRTVQMLLGHKDLRMTTRYAHLSQEHLQEAVKLLEGAPEEAGGYNTATTSVLAGTGGG
jgi:integrase